MKEMNKNKGGMVRVKALDRNEKEIFDYVKIAHLKRLIAAGYVVAVVSDIPEGKMPEFNFFTN